MSAKFKIKYFSVLFFLLSLSDYASHIVGGEIYYVCMGSNDYLITLKLYRDCINGQAPFDGLAAIGVFDINGNLKNTVLAPFPGSRILPTKLNSNCYETPTNVCVEEAIYTAKVNLPPLPGGYIISYQRCCRNFSTLNIWNSGNTGSTYTVQIPPGNACNNSPYYNKFPPVFLCANEPLNFDHSAVDPDGDSLVYELCDPFNGGDSINPQPFSPSPPPYTFVQFNSPYNGSYPMKAAPQLKIDPQSGLLTGTPTMFGQWVVGVCVKEYRNGFLLSTNKRDFQFNVVNCQNNVTSSIVSQKDFCSGNTVFFINNSLNANAYQWDFGDTSINSDTSSASSPIYTYNDTGKYIVTLIANPGMACADTAQVLFHIYPLLRASFKAPAGQCLTGNNFTFTAGGNFVNNLSSFYWDFGSFASPSASALENPDNIIYNASGSFPVTFSISEMGCNSYYTDSIKVYLMPKAKFSAPSQNGCNPFTAYFTNSSLVSNGTIMNYLWFFGDGTSSNEKLPSHTYSKIGNYTVTLKIETMNGCLDTITFIQPNLITVNPTPKAGFTVEPSETSIFTPEITVINKSETKLSSYFLLGDGQFSKLDSLQHIYADTGTYTITQIITNEFGCSDTVAGIVRINPEFRFWIPNSFSPNNDGINDIFLPLQIGLQGFEIEVFDKWGGTVFKTNDKNKGWDGRRNSTADMVSEDIYAYKIKFINENNKEIIYVGSVVLLK